MDCRKARHWIQLELDGELPGGRKRRLQRHLATCRGCAEAQEQFAAIRAGFRQMSGTGWSPERTGPAEFSPRRVGGRAVAAALAAAIAASVGLWMAVDRISGTGGQPAGHTLALHEGANAREGGEQRAAQLAKMSADPLQVRVRVNSGEDSIVMPLRTKNPNVTVFWIYPAVRTAQVRAGSGERPASPS